jgi:hypothetical protein
MSHALLRRLGLQLPANYSTARRNLLDTKGVFQRSAIVPNGSTVPSIEALISRFPLIAWDVWHKAVYLLTNDVKPPSHYPMFGWRHYQLIDYIKNGRLFLSPELEEKALGRALSLHGILLPQQIETLKRIRSASSVRAAGGPPVTSGRMLRRRTAHR